MADEKATAEAINNLASMFPEIDKEMITDIYLGCKKDFDQTIDQLIGMGAEQEKKAPPPVMSPAPAAKVVAPPTKAVVASAPPTLIPEVPHFTDSPAEKERLEFLNQQLSQEYRRLADTQERNLQLEKQLAAATASITLERQKLEEEKRKFEEEKLAFQQDKKRLEEHLSARLREMKEQMRRNEEEARAKEEASRREAELRREEERRSEEEARSVEKLLKREAKLRIKEEKKAQKARTREAWFQEEQTRMEQHSAEQQALIHQLKNEFSEREEVLKAQNKTLREALEELEHSVVVNQQSAQESIVEALQSVTNWLSKGVGDLQQKTITPASLKEELLKSLRDTL